MDQFSALHQNQSFQLIWGSCKEINNLNRLKAHILESHICYVYYIMEFVVLISGQEKKDSNAVMKMGFLCHFDQGKISNKCPQSKDDRKHRQAPCPTSQAGFCRGVSCVSHHNLYSVDNQPAFP